MTAMHHGSGIPDEVEELDGGQVLGGEQLPSMDIESHEGDSVQEAINRSEYFDHTAIGTVRGHAVMLTARVPEIRGQLRTPKLTVHVGGEWDAETDTYLGGSSHTTKVDRVWALDDRFGALCREHGLVIVPPQEADSDE